MVHSPDRRDGFTLFEVLLAVTALTAILAIMPPIFSSLQNESSLEDAVDAIIGSLRRAQLLAQASAGDSPWGVRVEPEQVTLFKGLSFTARDPGFDEVFELSGGIELTGDTELVFAKFSGELPASQTLRLTIPSGVLRTISLNVKGTVSY